MTARINFGFPARHLVRSRACVQRALSVGIDLGTTNSAVSVLKNGSPVMIPNELGEFSTPSIVSYTEDGEVLVGSAAKPRLLSHPDTTFSSVKRLMGKQ